MRGYRSLSLAVVAVALLAAMLVPSAFAATVKIVDDPHCKIALTGEIKAGDAEALKGRIKEKRPNSFKEVLSLCLSSPGGSYPEALKIIDVLLEAEKIGTVVKGDAECFSACALVFLAGNILPGDAEERANTIPYRTLIPGGKLGFHAPYAAGLENTPASQQTIGMAVKVGIDAMLDLLDRNELKLFPDKLLRRAMRLGPHEMYEIATVGDATAASILIPQLVRLPPVDEAAAARACTSALIAEGTHFETVEEVTKEKIADVERYDVVLGILEHHCKVTATGPLDQLSVWVHTKFPVEELTEGDAQYFKSNLRGTDSQWYFLLDSNTPIESLRGGIAAKPIINMPVTYRSYDFMGTDIGAVVADSAYACAVRCAEQGTCKAFSYNHWAKKCFLKSSFARSRFDPRSLSGNFTGSPNSGSAPQTVQKFRGKKFKDRSYYAWDASDFDECLARCLTQGDCIAVNFRKSDKLCEFFLEVGEYFPDAGYDAAMRWEAP